MPRRFRSTCRPTPGNRSAQNASPSSSVGPSDRACQRSCELLRSTLALAFERRVEPRKAVELAVASRFEHAVRVQDDRVADVELRTHLFVRLAFFDAENEPLGIERLEYAGRADDARRGMTGTRDRDRSAQRIDEQIDERDELPGCDLADDHVVRRLQEVARLRLLARKRA